MLGAWRLGQRPQRSQHPQFANPLVRQGGLEEITGLKLEDPHVTQDVSTWRDLVDGNEIIRVILLDVGELFVGGFKPLVPFLGLHGLWPSSWNGNLLGQLCSSKGK